MRRLVICGLLCVLVSGCGAEVRNSIENAGGEKGGGMERLAEVSLTTVGLDAGLTKRKPQPQGMPAAVVDRKIIYTAVVRLVVSDFDGMEERIEALVRGVEGYVAEYGSDRTQGERRAGEWIVRVPVVKFDGFLEAVGELGVPESRHVSSQDVSEEFVDLEARLANQRKLEERILQVLAEHTGKIEDLLRVETELARVREQIEQMEGRLRYLTNRVELTTVTIAVREQRDYVPPQAPSFAARVSDTFGESVDTLVETGEALALAAVAIVPWSPLFVPLVAVPVVLWRRWRGRITSQRVAV